MSDSAMSISSKPCVCTEDSTSDESLLSPNCECPQDDLGIVIHEQTCLMYKSEKIVYPHDPICECKEPVPEEPGDGICECCKCPMDQCRCNKSGREALDLWRSKRDVGAMPAVLESTHPLMQKFQETLKQFLLKENAIAEEEIHRLSEELKVNKTLYNRDLEAIYRSDHDTNAQRVMIEEYEMSLAQRGMERQAAEKRARESGEKHKQAEAKLNEFIMKERETTEEMKALQALCDQLQAWSDETSSDLVVSHRMSDKMRAEKRALADEKRQLDMFLFGLNNEVWKLESKLEMFKKQIEIKSVEMEKINDKVTTYAVELDDLDLDKRRLVSLWNSVLVNIKQRDNVYDSVRDDYNALKDHYQTLLNSLQITKNLAMEEMTKGKEISMNKSKLISDIEHATKTYDAEDKKRQDLEDQINQLNESIEMTERDQEMIRCENHAMENILKSTEKEWERKNACKLKLENEILLNLEDCLLNEKAVTYMANGIRKMREISRKQEISLTKMENQHAQIMLEIETQRNRQVTNNLFIDDKLALVKQKEAELEVLQSKYNETMSVMTMKQRALDIVTKRFMFLKEIFDTKSPQERRIEALENQVLTLRDRTEQMQDEWLRQQGHVVKLADQYDVLVNDINLISKQIQICDQKIKSNDAESEYVNSERGRIERTLRTLSGRLQVLERTRKDASERNESLQRTNVSVAHEYDANLKDAETEIIQLEDDIEELDKEKMNLTQELDRLQKEALIWQRKGMLAVDLKKGMKSDTSASGEIGQLKIEIHRMEVRREQLLRTSEKLAGDLAHYVTRRDTAMDKSRAIAAVEKSHGAATTSQTAYHHKLRLAKADVTRVTKEIAELKAHSEQLQKEQERLDREMEETSAMNNEIEEKLADLIKETRLTERNKQWLLERVVRAQRFGKELATAIKRQSVRVKKPKETILQEQEQARALNERLRYVVATLLKEYPYLEDPLTCIDNTLNIFSPEKTPELATKADVCSLLKYGEFRSTDEQLLENMRAELEAGVVPRRKVHALPPLGSPPKITE